MRDLHARPWIAGAALAALALIAVRAHAERPQVLRTGDRLVPLTVQTLTGQNASLRPTGRPEVINVFATWCPWCRKEVPALSALAERLQKRGVQFTGVDQEEDAWRVARFAHDAAIPYPVYVDDSNVTHDVLGARVIPTTIVVGKDGVIRWEHSGPLTANDWRALTAAAEQAG